MTYYGCHGDTSNRYILSNVEMCNADLAGAYELRIVQV